MYPFDSQRLHCRRHGSNGLGTDQRPSRDGAPPNRYIRAPFGSPKTCTSLRAIHTHFSTATSSTTYDHYLLLSTSKTDHLAERVAADYLPPLCSPDTGHPHIGVSPTDTLSRTEAPQPATGFTTAASTPSLLSHYTTNDTSVLEGSRTRPRAGTLPTTTWRSYRDTASLSGLLGLFRTTPSAR